MEPKFHDPLIERYTDRPFPPYRHLPFQNAHPFLDEYGHSFGEKLSPPDSFTLDNWQHCSDYLYCIDLFNYGFWWEAHERLKHLCIAAGRESEMGQFIQGLIQVSAAVLKHFMQEEQGAETLAKLGLGNLQKPTGIYLGIDIAAFVAQVKEFLQSGEAKYPQIQLLLQD